MPNVNEPHRTFNGVNEFFIRRGIPTEPIEPESEADRQRRDAEEAADERAQQNRESAAAYCDKNIPFRWADAVADHEVVAKWVIRFTANPRRTPSLLFSGTTGTGKTHQAYGALRAIADAGVNVRWQATTTANLYGALRPRKGVDSDEEFSRWATAPLLLLDDLGAAKSSEWTEEITYRLIDHRYAHCLPSLFTTNLPLRELADGLGDRIASRLIEMTEVVILNGEDRRRLNAPGVAA